MAVAPLRPCSGSPRCGRLTTDGRCPEHARQREQQRPNLEVRRWYRLAKWLRLRRQVLDEEPLCFDCLKEDRITASTDVDHEIPHRGDPELFWSRENLHGRCHSCHSRKTQRGQ